MAGYFYAPPPARVGGSQPYAARLGIVQSGPTSDNPPRRSFATLGVILAACAPASYALPKAATIAPLIPAAAGTANVPYTRASQAIIQSLWQQDPCTVIHMCSIAAFQAAPAAPDNAPTFSRTNLALVARQWDIYPLPLPKGARLAPLIAPAVVPSNPPPSSWVNARSILQSWAPRWPEVQGYTEIAPVVPAPAVPDQPPVLSYAQRNLLIDQWRPAPWRPLPSLRLLPQGAPPDTTPDQFSFTDQAGVALSSTITSAPITVAGINAASAITVTSGTYDINGSGTFVSTPGTVNAGDTVRTQHLSSAGYLTATNTVVTIGGISDTFTSITAGDPAQAAYIYRPFSFNWWSN